MSLKREGGRERGRKGGNLYLVGGDGSMSEWMIVAALAGWCERKVSATRRAKAEEQDSGQFKYSF